MTEEIEDDPELDGLFLAVGDAGSEVSASELDAMFGAVEADVEAARRKPLAWLRSRSTLVRRSLALGSFGVIFAVIAMSMPASDWAEVATVEIVLACVSLFVLLVASLMVAVRPLHLPELPRGRLVGLAAVSVLATFVLAATVGGPTGEVHTDGGSFWAMASPCMFFGLLVGVPVYAVARFVDRGAYLGSVLAAAAAGLTGNFMLQLRCPISDPLHNVAGHASVAVIFVGAILLVEAFMTRRAK